jgi:hypothetical protein
MTVCDRPYHLVHLHFIDPFANLNNCIPAVYSAVDSSFLSFYPNTNRSIDHCCFLIYFHCVHVIVHFPALIVV